MGKKPVWGGGSSSLRGPPLPTASLSSAEQRTFRCCSGGGDSGQRPLPLTASSPAPLLQFPLALPCSPTSGTALGVWPGGRYKVPGAGPGQPLSPLPPPPAGPAEDAAQRLGGQARSAPACLLTSPAPSQPAGAAPCPLALRVWFSKLSGSCLRVPCSPLASPRSPSAPHPRSHHAALRPRGRPAAGRRASAEPGRRSHPLPSLLRGEAGALPPPRGL